jgi:hypothetical protein
MIFDISSSQTVVSFTAFSHGTNWKTPEKLINVGTMGCHPALKQLTMSLAKLPQVDLWREEPGQWWHRPGAFQAPCTIFLLKWKVVGFIDSAYVIIRYLYMCVYHCLFISLINLLHVFSHKVVSWLKFSWTHGFTVVEAGRFRVSNTRIPSRDSQQGGPSFKLLLNPNKDP